MKILSFIVCAILFASFATSAQTTRVGIGTALPDSSAALDISSTTQGLLPPRMTTAEKRAISKPASGLIIYQTDSTKGIYINNGNPSTPEWQYLTPIQTTAPLAYGTFTASTNQFVMTPNVYQNISFSLATGSQFTLPNATSITVPKTAVYRIRWTTYLSAGSSGINYTATATTGITFNNTLQSSIFSGGANVAPLATEYFHINGEFTASLPAGTVVRLQFRASSDLVSLRSASGICALLSMEEIR